MEILLDMASDAITNLRLGVLFLLSFFGVLVKKSFSSMDLENVKSEKIDMPEGKLNVITASRRVDYEVEKKFDIE